MTGYTLNKKSRRPYSLYLDERNAEVSIRVWRIPENLGGGRRNATWGVVLSWKATSRHFTSFVFIFFLFVNNFPVIAVESRIEVNRWCFYLFFFKFWITTSSLFLYGNITYEGKFWITSNMSVKIVWAKVVGNRPKTNVCGIQSFQ